MKLSYIYHEWKAKVQIVSMYRSQPFSMYNPFFTRNAIQINLVYINLLSTRMLEKKCGKHRFIYIAK